MPIDDRTHHPSERAGLKYRRAVGDSFARELRRLREDDLLHLPLSSFVVDFNGRTGDALATMSIVDAVYAIQFNIHEDRKSSWAEAYEAIIYVKGS